jgi:hypothetical protein
MSMTFKIFMSTKIQILVCCVKHCTVLYMVMYVLEEPSALSRKQVHKKYWWPVMRMTNASYLRRHDSINTTSELHPSI